MKICQEIRSTETAYVQSLLIMQVHAQLAASSKQTLKIIIHVWRSPVGFHRASPTSNQERGAHHFRPGRGDALCQR